jgi:hypothetical protein
MLFSASHSFGRRCLKIVGINNDTIAFLDIDLPSLEPLITDGIADIFLSFNNIEIIPLDKISYQLLLNPLFLKDIKQPSILGEVKIFA